MKGIAHFITGVAIATFFPEVVHRAGDGSLLPVLGGVTGLLPDTLDFRFARYFQQYNVEIDPGPDPDPQQIAERLAEALERAYDTGVSQQVILHTVQLGADAWRQYTVHFAAEQGEIQVEIGPVVNTGQIARPGSEPEPPRRARVKVKHALQAPYGETYTVDIFTGPSFSFEREADGVRVRFLPWHRRWSHSLSLAMALGLISAGLIATLEILTHGTVSDTAVWAGLVASLGALGHIVEDQLGHMGSAIFFPFKQRRLPGLGLIHSGDPIPNFLTVWTSLTVILFNLNRYSPSPQFKSWWLLAGALGLPPLALGGRAWWQHQRQGIDATRNSPQDELLSETEGVGM